MCYLCSPPAGWPPSQAHSGLDSMEETSSEGPRAAVNLMKCLTDSRAAGGTFICKTKPAHETQLKCCDTKCSTGFQSRALHPFSGSSKISLPYIGKEVEGAFEVSWRHWGASRAAFPPWWSPLRFIHRLPAVGGPWNNDVQWGSCQIQLWARRWCTTLSQRCMPPLARGRAEEVRDAAVCATLLAV